MRLSRLVTWLVRDGDAQHVSTRWLRDLEREDVRVEFHNQRIDWPLNKARNDNGWRNRVELRNREVA